MISFQNFDPFSSFFYVRIAYERYATNTGNSTCTSNFVDNVLYLETGKQQHPIFPDTASAAHSLFLAATQNLLQAPVP